MLYMWLYKLKLSFYTKKYLVYMNIKNQLPQKAQVFGDDSLFMQRKK